MLFDFKLTTQELIYMLIALIAMLGVCYWAQSLKRRPRNIIGNRIFFFIFSLILITGSLYFISAKGLNYGLDFTGGTLLELGFTQMPQENLLHKSLVEYNPELSDAVIQLEKGPDGFEKSKLKKVLIRVKELKSKEKTKIAKIKQSEEVDKLVSFLEQKFGKIEIIKTEHIGPVIGEELKKKAIWALLIALGIQLIYITLRFGSKMRYGLAADIAMAHDVIIMVGIYVVVGRQVDSPFLAAVLTIIGYSVMDSIVIFDRIRENLKLFKKSDFEETVNTSVNQTMSRSVNTLVTCLFTLFALYFFGGATLKNFAFALLIGITSGAYSSIFVASPILVVLDNFIKKKNLKKAEYRRTQLAAQMKKPQVVQKPQEEVRAQFEKKKKHRKKKKRR